MCSERQAAANKRNAQKSTGPKTVEGKNKASQNAVTHGLTSHRPVLDNEDTAEFRKYVNELIDQLDPTNPWEFVFAKRASCQAWRIQRALCYETLALDNLLKSARDDDKTNPNPALSAQISTSKNAKTKNKPNSGGTFKEVLSISEEHPCGCSDPIENEKSLLGQAIVDDFRNHWTLDKLARYETRLENSMIRCLGKFQKVRESQMMNFTSLRHYYRGFHRRPQDFQDEPNVGQASPLGSENPIATVGADLCVCPTHNVTQASSLGNEIDKSKHSVDPDSTSGTNPIPDMGGTAKRSLTVDSEDIDKTNPISALSAQKPASENEIAKNEPNSGGTFKDVLSISEEHPCGCSGQIENRTSSTCPTGIENPNASDVSLFDQQKAALINDDFNSFSQWADLKGHAYGYDDESFEPHCPNPPSTGEYLYVENWHHKLLRMVNYPWDKRKNLTKAQLNEMVDTILCSMSDPVQFLWDFGLIELTAEAVGKRSLAAQTEEQVPALAC